MDVPVGQRRFFLSAGTIMLAGRFNDDQTVSTRVATTDDLAIMSYRDEEQLHRHGYTDVSTFRWIAYRALKQLAEREPARA